MSALVMFGGATRLLWGCLNGHLHELELHEYAPLLRESNAFMQARIKGLEYAFQIFW